MFDVAHFWTEESGGSRRVSKRPWLNYTKELYNYAKYMAQYKWLPKIGLLVTIGYSSGAGFTLPFAFINIDEDIGIVDLYSAKLA